MEPGLNPSAYPFGLVQRRNGFAFVTSVPIDSAEPTERVLEKIAFIRQTHYGGFYDFVPDLAMADTAYTNIALGAHTDTTYFSDPVGLQAFHLLSHTDRSSAQGVAASLGGQSLLVDGFYAASILKAECPEAFEVLRCVRLPWHASGNEGITISPDKLYPVLEVNEATGKLHRVRWNNDDRGVVPFGEMYSPAEWYEAARKWHEILTRKSVENWFQLKPGQVLSECARSIVGMFLIFNPFSCDFPFFLRLTNTDLVFDNWRVLHGRAAFTGTRRMCGGYSMSIHPSFPTHPHLHA